MTAKALKPLLFVVAIMAVVSLACLGGGTPTQAPATEAPQQPQQVDQPVIEPTPTEAPVTEAPVTEAPVTEAPATEAPATEAPDFFTEEFEGDISNWSYFNILGSSDANESALTLETDNGYLVFDIATKQLYTYVTYDPYTYEDVAIELSADNRGTNNNAISMVCRYSDEGWYEVNVQNNGLYNILAATYNPSGDVNYARLADGGSNKIRVGKDTNTYKMICKGRTIILYINGYETRKVDDNQYVLRDGQVGFSVSSFEDPTVRVEVDWVTLSQP